MSRNQALGVLHVPCGFGLAGWGVAVGAVVAVADRPFSSNSTVHQPFSSMDHQPFSLILRDFPARDITNLEQAFANVVYGYCRYPSSVQSESQKTIVYQGYSKQQ